MIHDVVIVGSGPAGYTAAIYAARAGLDPLVLAGSVTAGGALMSTTEVENYPGFVEGIQGPELMGRMQEQAERLGAEIRYEDVTGLELVGEVKRVTTDDGVYEARTVIVATGSEYRRLGVEGEDRLSGHGVSYCATCDGFFFRDRPIVVVGGGDAAMEEALFLARFGSSVTVVHRRDALRASAAMARRALDDPRITFAWNSRVVGLGGQDALESVTLEDTLTGQHRQIPAVRGHWPDPPHRARQGRPGAGRRRLRPRRGPQSAHQRPRGLRLRRRGRSPLPAGDHGSGIRVPGRPGRRALPGRPRLSRTPPARRGPSDLSWADGPPVCPGGCRTSLEAT